MSNIIDHDYLQNLYSSNNYEDILNLNDKNNYYLMFYAGKVYKDLCQNENAIEYLEKFIYHVDKLDNHRKNDEYKDLLISAYFNLGELCYLDRNTEKAEKCFSVCLDLTDNSHVKAFQYLFKLDPDSAKERLVSLINRRNWVSRNYLTWVPPGHYYSPIPEIEDVKKHEECIFNDEIDTVDGINLNGIEQLDLFEELKQYYKDQPFMDAKQKGMRYYFSNDYYLYTDAIILYSMIRFLKPRRIIEVGSGFSSAVIMDTNEKFFDNRIQCTFIEPYPERLLSILKEDDLKNNELIQSRLQDLDDHVLLSLSEGDILFIDSSHVSKINSDVNYIFFNILPRLKKGVIIHFHDIFYPFEYPKNWIYEGRAWNEAYILRAFLQYNDAFKIRFFNSFFAKFHIDKLSADMPLCVRNTGASIWIEKVK